MGFNVPINRPRLWIRRIADVNPEIICFVIKTNQEGSSEVHKHKIPLIRTIS